MQQQQSLTVYVPKPCHENWDQMNPTEKGKFCNACAKQVIDFSLLSDNQILEFLNKSKTGVCGRFANDQLSRPLQPLEKNKKKSRWLAIAMPLLLLFNKSRSQDVLVKGDTVYTTQQSVSEIMGDIAVQIESNAIIEGKVVDDTGQAIPFATLQVSASHYTIQTDINGIFKFDTSKLLPNTRIVIAAVGFETKTLAPETFKSDATIVLNRIESMLICETLGVVVTVQKPPLKKTLLSTIKNTFTTDSLKVYPNPAIAGSIINVQVKQVGQYQILLFDEGNHLLHYEAHDVANTNSIISYELPQFLPRGMYYIKAEEVVSKKSFTKKIIIQ